MQLLIEFICIMRPKNLTFVKRFFVDFIFWFFILKCLMLFHAFLEWEKVGSHHQNKSAPIKINYNHLRGKLLSVNDSFQIMDNPSIQFLKLPRVDCPTSNPTFDMLSQNSTNFKEDQEFTIVAMVLSAPANHRERMRVRKNFENWRKMRNQVQIVVIFLLGKVNDEELKKNLEREDQLFGDILQSTVPESYATLSYKSISGFIWINSSCPNARFLVKLDDDATINWKLLVKILQTRYANEKSPLSNSIACPSVMKNMRPWRPKVVNREDGIQTVMSKWSVTYEETNRRVHPNFCPGWIYVTSPTMALNVAEAAADNPQNLKLNRLDDIYLTGYARERVEGSQVEPLETGLTGLVWTEIFSRCPFLGITKNIFFNQLVIKKGTYIKNGWFYWCAFFEYFILDNFEYFSPGIIPNSIVKVCQR